MKVPSADEIVKEAKAAYYKDPKAEWAYENSFVLGWLKSSYDRIADELNERRGDKKKLNSYKNI